MPDTCHYRYTKVVDEEVRIFRRFVFLHRALVLIIIIIGKLGELGSDETDRRHLGEKGGADVIHRSIGQPRTRFLFQRCPLLACCCGRWDTSSATGYGCGEGYT